MIKGLIQEYSNGQKFRNKQLYAEQGNMTKEWTGWGHLYKESQTHTKAKLKINKQSWKATVVTADIDNLERCD